MAEFVLLHVNQNMIQLLRKSDFRMERGKGCECELQKTVEIAN